MTMVPLSDLQRESTWVNELNGLVAHLVGALHEVMHSQSIEAAKTCAEMAVQNVAEYHAGHWKPGPGDDPDDWRTK